MFMALSKGGGAGEFRMNVCSVKHGCLIRCHTILTAPSFDLADAKKSLRADGPN
jgi:hypothetical protein